MEARAKGFVLATLVAVSVFALFPPLGEAPPQLPTFGGVVVQSNITGVANGVALLPSDKFVIVGEEDALDLVAGDLNLKPYRGFIAKYSSTASNEWVRTVNFGAYDVLWGVTTDSSGNIYAAGYTYTDGQDYWPWIFKYSADGDELWSLNISVSGATDAYVFGITLDGTTLTSVGYARVSGESRPLVVQASTSGTQLSAWYGTGTRILLSVDQTGTSGYFYATGIITPWQRALSKITASSIEWNADSTDHRGWDVSAQGGIPFVAGSKKDNGPPAKYFFSTAKYSSSGTLTWNRLHDESALLPNYDGLAIITDSSSNSYVSGSDKTLISKPVENPGAFIETWVIKGPAGSHDAMSLKYDSSGSLQWSASYGDATYDYAGLSNVIDSYPHLIVAGFKADLTLTNVNPLVLRYENI